MEQANGNRGDTGGPETVPAPLDTVTVAAEALLRSGPWGGSMILDASYVGCLCGRTVYEHSTMRHAMTCAKLRARVSEGGAK